MSQRPVRRPPREQLGARGEELAAAFLEARGYRIAARNWRPGTAELSGELDLVAVRGGVVAFVEVKTRRSEAFGGPFAAVTWSKQARIRALAAVFLRSAGLAARTVRFDVIGIVARVGQPPVVQHIPGAF